MTDPTAEDPPAIDLDSTATDVARPARRRFPVLIAAGATLALLIGVGIGYQALSGDSRRPEQFTPASVIAFASIDLDPGMGQQLSLLRLAKQLPDEAGVKDVSSTKGLVERVLGDAHLSGVDVSRDLTNWLGLRAGVSAWTDAQKHQYALISVLSRNDSAANAGLRRIADAADGNLGFVVKDGTALIAIGEGDAGAAAQAAAAEAAKTPLADLDAFRQARDWLTDEPIVLVWADLARASETVLAAVGAPGLGAPPGATGMDPAKGTIVLGVRATDDGIEAQYRTFGAGGKQAPTATDAMSRLGNLPGNTRVGGALTLPKELGQGMMSSFTASGLMFGGLGLPLLFGGLAFSDMDGGDVVLEPGQSVSAGDPNATGCDYSWSTDGLSSAEMDEVDKLMKKDPNDLSKAARKRLKTLIGFDPTTCDFTGPEISDADMKELESLISKDPTTLTKAERKRYKELTGVDPMEFSTPGFDDGGLFEAAMGATVDVGITSLGDVPGVRISAAVASADAAQKLVDIVQSGDVTDVKAAAEGSTVVVTSREYVAGDGKLADLDLFRRTMPKLADAGAGLAFYADVRSLAEKDRPDVPVRSVGIVEGSQDGDVTGAVRVLIG